jgi:hypothetical protein
MTGGIAAFNQQHRSQETPDRGDSHASRQPPQRRRHSLDAGTPLALLPMHWTTLTGHIDAPRLVTNVFGKNPELYTKQPGLAPLQAAFATPTKNDQEPFEHSSASSALITPCQRTRDKWAALLRQTVPQHQMTCLSADRCRCTSCRFRNAASQVSPTRRETAPTLVCRCGVRLAYSVSAAPAAVQCPQCHFTNSISRSLSPTSMPSTPTTMTFQSMDDAKVAVTELLKFKDSTTVWYLAQVETAVDEYLSSRLGFHRDAIPYNYLDEPPANMGIVRSNLDALEHCASEAYHTATDFCRTLITPTVTRIWRDALHPVMNEIDTLVTRLDRTLHHMLSDGANVTPFLSEEQLKLFSAFCESSQASLIKDIAHIESMFQLETTWLVEEEAGRNDGVSDVVPVAGLALSRVHRLLNEHQTVVDHWGRRRS